VKAPEVILGIFGGMGPEATADLYRKIIDLTPAEKDQDHIPTLIYSLPQVPERTESIRNKDLSILPYIIGGVKRLEKAGASFIAIPCNTVHYYYGQMAEAIHIPIIHMIRETVREVEAKQPGARRVGILATAGTLESGLYGTALEDRGLEAIIPEEDVVREKVMQAVFGIKSGQERMAVEGLLADAGRHLADRGAEAIILGCTEIPLVFDPASVDVPVVDATLVLAERAVDMYFKLLGSPPKG
jgi:aspartate racemase